MKNRISETSLQGGKEGLMFILPVLIFSFFYLSYLHIHRANAQYLEDYNQLMGDPGQSVTQQIYQLQGTNTVSPTPTAGGGYYNQEKIPGASGQTNDFPTYLKQIVNFGFAAIGIMAMFMLMIGAYQYLMAAGNIAKEDSAKTTISSAFAGLVLGLVAFLLLRTINPDLVSFNLAVLQGGLTGGGVATKAPTGGGTVSPSDMSKVNCDTVRNYDGFMNKNKSDLYNENVNSAQDLQNALEKFRAGPTNGLTKYSDTIYQACKDNNVPYWYAIGTFAKESSMFFEYKNGKDGEKYGCSYYNNPGCILDKATGKPQQYPDEITGIRENIATMGRRISENPTPLGAWNAWYWPDRPGNCAGAQGYLDIFSKAAGATGLSGI